jgi:hypothetical protein
VTALDGEISDTKINIIRTMKIKTKLLTLLSTPVIVGGGFAPLFLNQCGNDTEQFQHVFLDNADDMNAYLQDHVKSINTTGVP